MTPPPDTTMVEVVARALAGEMVYGGYNAETQARFIQQNMGIAKSMARAAIAAIPKAITDAMLPVSGNTTLQNYTRTM